MIGEAKVVKNFTILVIAVTLLIVVCNSRFNIGPVSFKMPSHSTTNKAEQKIMDGIQIIENAKDEARIRIKARQVVEQLEAE